MVRFSSGRVGKATYKAGRVTACIAYNPALETAWQQRVIVSIAS